MHVIEVIPLVRGISIESLSYFSNQAFSLGTIITIPVRGKQVQGVVIESKPVSSTKTALKAATFSLRKLPPQPTVSQLPAALLETVTTLAQQLPYKRGAILFALLPPDIRNGSQPFPGGSPYVTHEESAPSILAAPTSERFITYRSIIRTAFAHRGSVLLVVPTSADVAPIVEHVRVGIEDRVITFGAHQTKRAREKSYREFEDMSKTKLIITTPSFAYLDRPDYSTIIVDQSASSHYTCRERPYLNHCQVLRTLAHITKRTIICGDILPTTEDEYGRRMDHYQTLGEHPKRLELPAQLTIVTQNDRPTTEVPFQLFSPELIQRMTTTLSGRHNVFLYAARRGLAPVVACYDCGHIFRCPDSGTPFSLFRTYDTFRNEKRWFISSTSGKRVPAADVCDSCGSWRLRERGIGIQHVYDECQQRFPDTPLILFDHTTASTFKKATALMTDFTSRKGAILLGTTMALPYLSEPVHLSSIVSLDATRSIPSWRADEQIFRLLLTLREKSVQEVIVQTRNQADDLLLYATRGAVERFFDDEIELRKMLSYPPFTTFILLTWQGSQEVITTTEKIVKAALTQLTPALSGQYYTNPNSVAPKLIRHCLIRTQDPTPRADLVQILRSLPPHIAVIFNPDRIV